MCRAKAQDGQRCQGHRRAAVSGSIAMLVAAVSPDSRRAVEERFAAVTTSEGTSGNATREETDQFFTEAIVRAEACASLTARQRTSVVERLREAVGRLVVSRETLAAWKATLDRAWARVGRATTGVLLAATLAIGAGGCGTGRDTSPAPEPTVTAASVAPEVREHAADPIPKPDVPAHVATYFGSEEKARKAYQRLATTYMDGAMRADLLTADRADASPGQFAIRELMTPETRDRFDARLAKAATGDDEAYYDTGALALYDAFDRQPDVSLTPGVPSSIVQRRIENPRMGMAADGRVKITMTTKGAVRATEKGERALSPYSATVTFFVEKNGKISGWHGGWDDAGDDVPDRW